MRAVELEAVEVKPLSVPTEDPFAIATGVVHATRSVVVTVGLRDVKDGRRAHGLGEGSCFPPVTREDQPDAIAAVERAAPALVGAVLGEPSELSTLLDATLAETPVARAAVEVAVLDALARLDDAPLYQWLAGSDAEAAPLETDMTVPLLPPARMAELAAQWWARGFRALKCKVGKDLDADLRALEAMLRAAPGARFRPDANGGQTVAEALAFVAGAQRLGATIECFEQPCASREELAEVARALELPVVADESVKQLADLEGLAVDAVNLKIAKTGSLLRARELGAAAKARGLKLMMGGMVETRLGMTAAAHLAASLGGVDFADLDTAWLLTTDPFDGGYEATGALLRLPLAAGLALTLR